LFFHSIFKYGRFLSGFLTKTVYAFLISDVYYMSCPSHLCITLIIFCEG
jgi:hypothetical protein